MQSWKLLRLEPASLREPDDFGAPTSLAGDGSHLASTLAHLAGSGRRQGPGSAGAPGAAAEQVYGRVAARLTELAGEVGGVWVDADEKREVLTLMAGDRAGTAHAARALSDGTLRFLALAVLELDPRAAGLVCLEEPENGIHPARIPGMLRLLRDIPVNVEEQVGPDNPPRQVIVNTHSPAVVSQVPDASLLLAAPEEVSVRGRIVHGVAFGCLAGTWRQAAGREGLCVASRAQLLSHLEPIQRPAGGEWSERLRRGGDRAGQQPLLPYS
jgi:hypothetical protein